MGWAGGMAQSVECLPPKPKDLSLIPRIYMEKSGDIALTRVTKTCYTHIMALPKGTLGLSVDKG